MPHSTAQLELTGRLLIWTLRHGIRSLRRRQELPRFVRHTLTRLPGGESLLVLTEDLLAHLVLGAKRPLSLACPESGCLTRDESDLIMALAAAQAGLGAEVRLVLAESQHCGGLTRTAGALNRLAGHLSRHHLPLSRCETDMQMPFAFDAVADSHATPAARG